MLSSIVQSLYKLTTAPQSPATSQSPAHTQVLRFRVMLGETRTIPLAAQLNSIIVISPEIAAAVLTNTGLTLTGLRVGETMVIGFEGSHRVTFLVEVKGRTYANTHRDLGPVVPAALTLGAFSGSYGVSYSAPFAGGPTLLRQSFDFQKKLSEGRTLRFSSDVYKFMGQAKTDRTRLPAFGLDLNRMSLGIDSPDGSLDVLDSSLSISPLSFNGSTMRGFHLVSTPSSRLHGIEIFAGQARPSLSLFDMNQGRVLGIIAPVAQGERWRVRAGMFVVSPGSEPRLGNGGSGGTVWHLDGRYAVTKQIAAEGEVAYAEGGLSWRARLDLQTRRLSATGEVSRLDKHSPLISIGVQSGGRASESVAFQWRANSRLNASFSFNHVAVVPPINTFRAALDRTTLSATASYQINRSSRLSARFMQQQIETGAALIGSHFRLETRTLSVSHDLHFNKSWTNNLTARLTSTREPLGDTPTAAGVAVNEQLRYSFRRGSATAFVNYTRQQQTLAGLIFRNPRLLPPLLQDAFLANPTRFLEENRDSLDLLLPGVELPQTRGLETGLRLQAAFRRINIAGEARYSAGEILAREQRSLVTSLSVNMRLDAANSLQLSGSRSFGATDSRRQSAFTVSYVHRFGAGSGDGMQFTRLLGLERGHVQGRVFFDVNGNGADDEKEPGIGGMKIQLGGDTATTDASGRFKFAANSGAYQVSLISDELGMRWRASTMTEQHGFLPARETVNISFGLTDYGSVAGRVFNDVSQKGEQSAGSLPGVTGVRLTLRPANPTVPSPTVTVDGSGSYQFRNIPPGSYTLELDAASLPADFAMLRQTSWPVVVRPLQNFYLDIPISAQRAISGFVFVDQDRNGKFDPEKDQPVEGARVTTGKIEVVTGKGGAYILRNVTAGAIEVRAHTSWGTKSEVIRIELGTGPTRRYGINLAVPR